MNDQFVSDDTHGEVNLRVVLEKYLIHWKWFVLGIVVAYIVAFVYLRYTTPQYLASTTILVKDDKRGGVLSELSAFSDLALGSGIKSNLDNEIEILKSRGIVESTVRKLKLNISIVEKGRINDVEIYKDASIYVNFINVNMSFFTASFTIELEKLTADSFKLNKIDDLQESVILLSNKNVFKYGEIIPTKVGNLIITRNFESRSVESLNKNLTYISLRPLDNVVASFRSRLDVAPISKTSSVVSLSLKDSSLNRAKDFLNTLVQIYNEDAAADKNFIAENTSKFIRERLILITKELDGVEKGVETFKQSNNLTDIESEAMLFIESSNDYSKQNVDNEVQLNVVTSLLNFLKKSSNADLLPTNILSVPGQNETAGLISNFNILVLKRNRLLKSATITNPAVVVLDQEISSLKFALNESLVRILSNLSIQKRQLKGEVRILDSKIGKIPVQERQFRSIARQQKVKEELYLYLLEKREESAIALSATAPNARVIDDAVGSKSPIAPNRKMIFLSSIMLGLVIPFGILYLINLFDNKVKSRVDVTDKINMPFLGDIPRSLTPSEIISVSSRSSAAEALRIVRTNLDFMLNQVADGKAKTIFVTSTIPGEGKTFLSVNLAGIFALSGKKVLLIGMDIRSPKLNEYIGLSNPKGLSDYLSTKNADINDYINKFKGYEALDVLLAGSIPPNPTEILMNIKIDGLFDKFKNEYDFILVDTAPVSLVSDTLIIAKYADTFVYVVRANFMDKRMLEVPEGLHKDNKLRNMAFVINDTVVEKGYGYGYGVYGYGTEQVKKPWYKKIFKQ